MLPVQMSVIAVGGESADKQHHRTDRPRGLSRPDGLQLVGGRNDFVGGQKRRARRHKGRCRSAQI